MSKVSIIIPSYRQPQFLGRAIESCLEQDHADLEVIVIDDRSRDASLGLALSIARRDDRVTVVEAEENGGLGRARNLGLSMATGEFLCFLDSDDYLLPGSIRARLEAWPEAVERYGNSVVAVYGDWQHVSEPVDFPKVRAPRSNMNVVDASNYTGENVFICSAPLVRRTDVVAAGGFPEGLPMLEDFALWAKMIAAGGRFVPVRHVVTTYRQRPNSMLRGEDGVVMSEYVDVINTWMESEGTSLSDGGAMQAWLDDSSPMSFGRMSWNVPSVMGHRGRNSAAGSLRSSEAADAEDLTLSANVGDFMVNPVTEGLSSTVVPWSGAQPTEEAMAIEVCSLRDSLVTIGMIEDGLVADVAITSPDPDDWSTLWPLALAGLAVEATPASADAVRPALTVASELGGDPTAFIDIAFSAVWPNVGSRRGSIVYLPRGFESYPAMDAWISTALRALAEAGLDPRVMAEPEIRPHIGGFRSDLVSVSTVRSAELIVTPPGSDLALLEALSPTIVFEPSAVDTTNPQTLDQLRRAIVSSTTPA